MSQLYGVGLNIETNRIINEFRMQLQKRRGIALRAVSLALHERGAQLSCADFEKVLACFNIFPSKVHLQTLMKSFGGDHLCVESFMKALRPCLNERRCGIVKAAWERIAGD